MKGPVISAIKKPSISLVLMSGRCGRKCFSSTCAGRVVAADLVAQVSYPSIDVSLKDGFAVKSTDVVFAKRSSPVCLKVAGSAFAGVKYEGHVENGSAVKIYSGASIPDGADAVVAGEFCEEISPGEVSVKADVGTGRNIMRAGVEVEAGTTIVSIGERLLPGHLGLAAAAGIKQVMVYRRPRVAIISISDEVVVRRKPCRPAFSGVFAFSLVLFTLM